MANIASNEYPGKVYDLSSPSKANDKETTTREEETGHPVGPPEDQQDQEQGKMRSKTSSNKNHKKRRGITVHVEQEESVETVADLDSPTIDVIPQRIKQGDPIMNSGGTQTEQKNCCSLVALDIINATCLFLTAISFIVGATMMLERNNFYNLLLSEPFSFWLIGALFHLPVASINVVKRKSKGALEIHIASIGLFGSVLWFVASIFLFYNTFDVKAWGLLWILGSIFHLYVTTYDMVIFFRGETKSVFNICALIVAWMANFVFVIGAGLNTRDADTFYSGDDTFYSGASVLIAGSVLYLIYAIFATLSTFLQSSLVCTVHISRSGAMKSDRNKIDDDASIPVSNTSIVDTGVGTGNDNSRAASTQEGWGSPAGGVEHKENIGAAQSTCTSCFKSFMDVLAAVCLFSSSLLFIVGAVHFLDPENDVERSCKFYYNRVHLVGCFSSYFDDFFGYDYDDYNYRNYRADDFGSKQEPFLYWLVGAVLYFLFSVYSAIKRCSRGTNSTIAGLIGLAGASCLVIGSVFLLRGTYNFMAWGVLWEIGSAFNLIKLCNDTAVVMSFEGRSFVLILCVASGWIANALILGTVVWMILYEKEIRDEEMENLKEISEKSWEDDEFQIPVYILISGTIMMSLYSIILLLLQVRSIFSSRTEEGNKDENEVDEEEQVQDSTVDTANKVSRYGSPQVGVSVDVPDVADEEKEGVEHQNKDIEGKVSEKEEDESSKEDDDEPSKKKDMRKNEYSIGQFVEG